MTKQNNKAKKKYRIIIQQRKTKNSELEACRSFMHYDITGKSTISSIKKKLIKTMN